MSETEHKQTVDKACDAKRAPPDAAAQPRRKRRRWMMIGPVAGVVFAAALTPLFQSCRDKSVIASHAAFDLQCARDQIEVRINGDNVVALGCDDEVNYRISCRPLRREGCLTQTSWPNRGLIHNIEKRLAQPR
ncbi:MAG: hypothetical protein IPK60_17980 [Sandaracinaceae bacterium]|nr:hypothetical protein [Sandaracinaceae bacterium]